MALVILILALNSNCMALEIVIRARVAQTLFLSYPNDPIVVPAVDLSAEWPSPKQI